MTCARQAPRNFICGSPVRHFLYPCPFLNFSQSRSTLELATRKAIVKLEGEEKNIESYLDPDSPEYEMMVKEIAATLGMDTLMFQRLEDLVKAIGLPKAKLCTHCWGRQQYFLILLITPAGVDKSAFLPGCVHFVKVNFTVRNVLF